MFLFLKVNISVVFVSSEFVLQCKTARSMLLAASVCLKFLLHCTLGADALVIELLLVYDVAVYHFRAFQTWSFLIEQVFHLTAFLAEEVNVRGGVAIVANSVFVDGYHLSCSILAHHSQCVVYGGLAERWHIVVYTFIYVVDGGVDGVRHEVFHDGKSLH